MTMDEILKQEELIGERNFVKTDEEGNPVTAVYLPPFYFFESRIAPDGMGCYCFSPVAGVTSADRGLMQDPYTSYLTNFNSPIRPAPGRYCVGDYGFVYQIFRPGLKTKIGLNIR